MTMTKERFCKRLTQLRIQKGVSARDMSLSLGQAPGYINTIENGASLPSMASFFYICEYLEVEPKDFFDLETASPTMARELYEAAKPLTREQLEHLTALAKDLQG